MKTKQLLVAESGSTKTDWAIISNKKITHFATQGIHPYFLQKEEIVSIFETELNINPKKISFDEIHFYGAGISSNDSKHKIENCLIQYFNCKNAHTYSDMLASARATCLNDKGIACILGTGSNSCFFNGKKISHKTHSLGYILGDEGSGNHLGKKVLQYYLHNLFEEDMKKKFEAKYSNSIDEILENIYKKPFPNRYLAQYASFIFENRGNFMIENIAEDVLNDFFINHLLRYKEVWKTPIHFTGSVAFFLKDILENLCHQYELKLGNIIQRPMKGLVKFHQLNLK